MPPKRFGYLARFQFGDRGSSPLGPRSLFVKTVIAKSRLAYDDNNQMC